MSLHVQIPALSLDDLALSHALPDILDRGPFVRKVLVAVYAGELP